MRAYLRQPTIRGVRIGTSNLAWQGIVRKAAGVILIILGALTVRLPGTLFLAGVPSVIVLPMSVLLVALVAGGGVCALLRIHWWWASAGAAGVLAVEAAIVLMAYTDDPLLGEAAATSGSILFVAPAVVAGIFLYNTKTEFRTK